MDGKPFGRYRLLEKLGEGGMGQVFKAFDTLTDRIVAIKILPPEAAPHRDFQDRFRLEARITASLREPHVVPIHDFGEIDGRLYLDMRLIEGSDLKRIIADSGPQPAARVVALVDQIASALDAAHSAGLVHRDIKPSNILVTDNDFAYLIDFGIARAAGEAGLTSTGTTIGTFAYMAPERFTSGSADARTDVYALACVLFECLTGQQPFPGDSLEQQISAHLTTPPPRPSNADVDIVPVFDDVVTRGMAKDPADRYSSAGELAGAAKAALASYRPDGTVQATLPKGRSPRNPDDTHNAVPKRRRLLIGASLAAAVSIGAACIFAWRSIPSTHDEHNAVSAASLTSTSGRAAEQPQSVKSTTTAVPSPSLSATAVAEKLRTAVDSIAQVVTITEDNDPNNLIGRPRGYIDAAVVYDNAVQCGAVIGVDCGATIEVWPNAEQAQRRADYIAEVHNASRIFGKEYHHLHGSVLLRVAGDMKPSDNQRYATAFANAFA
ncbi:serine/threonine-protein kinase [Nocardia sp. NPDC056541]|uniref:serine/threonine-protein kinase n=1 Tax=Nocardia sp. NPDC056541 TaxID=3345860 RepID=UPI00366C051C